MGQKSRTPIVAHGVSPSDRATRPAAYNAASQRIALTAAAIGGFLTPFMGSAVNVALLAIRAEFHLDAFITWEGRAQSPLLELRLFHDNPVFVYSNLAALINYSATFAVPFLLSLYFKSFSTNSFNTMAPLWS